jgi:hypothetical protein
MLGFGEQLSLQCIHGVGLHALQHWPLVIVLPAARCVLPVAGTTAVHICCQAIAVQHNCLCCPALAALATSNFCARGLVCLGRITACSASCMDAVCALVPVMCRRLAHLVGLVLKRMLLLGSVELLLPTASMFQPPPIRSCRLCSAPQ